MTKIYDKTDAFHWSSDEKFINHQLKSGWEKYQDGDVFISLDPQERLGEGTICVSKWSEEQGEIVQLGLFWSKGEAERYAQVFVYDLKRGLE